MASTAQQAFDTWHKKTIWTRVLAIAGLLVALVLFMLQDYPTVIDLMLVAVVEIAIVVANFVHLSHLWQGVMQILSHDCDPQKGLEVAERMNKLWGTRHNRKDINSMGLLYAYCSLLLGYDDVALAWVQKVSENSPRLSDWTGILDIRVSAATHESDWGRLQQLRDQALQLAHDAEGKRGRLASQAAGAARRVVSAANAQLYAVGANWTAALEEVGRIEDGVQTPLQEVANSMRRAKLLDQMGMADKARPHFSFVAEHAGTCTMRDEAQQWLSAHAASPAAPSPAASSSASPKEG